MNVIHPNTTPLTGEDCVHYDEKSSDHFVDNISSYDGIQTIRNQGYSFQSVSGSEKFSEDEFEFEQLLTLDYTSIKDTNRKKHKRSMTSKKKTKLNTSITLEVEKLLQKANDAYLEKKFILAIETLEEVVVRAPGLHDPFHMLGLIYEQELEDKEKAIGFYLVAAHLVGNDLFLWKRIGQMCSELEDWNRTIYCYLKCIKSISYSEKINGQDATADLEDEIRFELSNAYHSINEISRCIQQLKILFLRHPGDPMLGKELAKCYHKIGKLNLAAETLESCIEYSEDMDIVNMLCELYIDLKLFQKCVMLVENYFSKLFCKNYSSQREMIQSSEFNINDNLDLFLSRIPIDISVKYAIANLNLGSDYPAYFVSKIIGEGNVNEFIDLHLALADSYFHIGNYKSAVDHYSYIESTKSHEYDIQFNFKFAFSLYKLELNDHAIRILEKILETNKTKSGDFNISRAKTLLASIYTKMGFDNLSEELLYTMKYEDIVQSKDITLPIPQEMRVSIVIDLFSEMKDKYSLLFGKNDLLPFIESAICPKFGPELDFKVISKFAVRFTNIINEFLIDNKRISQLVYYRKFSNENKQFEDQIKKAVPIMDREISTNKHVNMKTQKKKTQRSNTQISKIRSELGLITLEEILTSEKEFWEFLTLGAISLQFVRQNNVAVEIFKKLFGNLKLINPEINIESLNSGKRSLLRLLLSLSFEGGLWRALLSFLREEYYQKNANKKAICKLIGNLILMPQIFYLNLTNDNINYYLEKEAIGETRSWIQRQISHSNNQLELLIVTAHLYVLSSRLNQAINEYIKIHRLLPFNDLISLCLGVSFIGLSSSKESKNKILPIIKGFSFINRYINGRKSIYIDNSLYKAECFYNLGRAFHQINLKTNAVTSYLRCVGLLNSSECEDGYEYNRIKKMACYNLSLIVGITKIDVINW
ncbi:tfc4p like TFIIIC subunit TPR repeat containing basal transcription factor [Cryptosporidium xiaoi]|uniref:Tfc4p like TFIIIC subunit TPR repeat containing basal transcription factor n=1 Tax=Cryptosporidium xiaoi TaxID=659607 RepID=A0AAV9XZ06_9CRYT